MAGVYSALALLTLVPLVPALLMSYLPTVDGPAHVLEGSVLATYGAPGSEVLRRYYEVSAEPSPNVLTQLLLAAFVRVMSPSIAEKVFVVIVVSLFAVGTTYAARSIDRRGTFVAALAAPLATGYLFWFGFYNFSLGLGLSMLTLGYALRCRSRWTPLRALIVAGLLLLTASAHLLPFAMVATAITVAAVADVIRAVRRGDAGAQRPRPDVGQALRRFALAPFLALLLPTALSLVFLLRSNNVREVGPAAGGRADGGSAVALALRASHLVRVTVGQLAVYERTELALGGLLLGTVFVLVVLAVRRRPRPVPAAILVPATMLVLCVLLYLGFPDTVGTLMYINVRFALFAILFTLLMLAAVPTPRLARRGAVVAACVVAVGLSLARVGDQARINQDLREYASGAAVLPPGSTFVPFRAVRATTALDPTGSADPGAHQASRLAVLSGAVQLNHLDGRYDYFPAHFRDLSRLGARSSDLATPTEWLQLLDEGKAGGIRPDYVLVWGRVRADPQVRADPAWQLAQGRLDSAYREVWVSKPRGLLEVYRRR